MDVRVFYSHCGGAMIPVSTRIVVAMLCCVVWLGLAMGAMIDLYVFLSHGMAMPLLGAVLCSYVFLYIVTKRDIANMKECYVSVLGYSAVMVSAGLLGCYVWMQSTEELYRVAPVLPVLWAGLTVVFLVIFFCVFDTIRFVLS